MKLKVIFLGKTRERYIDAGIQDYFSRLTRYTKAQIQVVKEKARVKSSAEQLREESKILLDNVDKKSFLVVLDPMGKELRSEQLAELIVQWQQQAKQNIVFVIGGPLGLDNEVKRRADLLLSLSRMTFTHEIARLLLIEQLYRAFSIRAGTKYHK